MYALSINKLRKTFPNGVEALRTVDLKIAKGDFFALLGPNGAGKSTLIGIISSLVSKSSGTVHVLGHDITTEPVVARGYMGLVPQELNFPMFEKVINILVDQAGYYGIPRKIALVRAQKYLKKLGLWHKRNEQASTLSGGMKRRLMIARALVHEPKILILDEPTAGVDIELRRSTWEFLRELNKSGTTILLTTHYLEEAEYLCNGIAIINRGVILEQTVMRELLKQLPYERLVLDLQAPIDNLNLPELLDIKLELQDPTTLEITFCKSLNLNTVFAELSKHNINVNSMRNKSNRLEELFLSRINNHE